MPCEIVLKWNSTTNVTQLYTASVKPYLKENKTHENQLFNDV
jgi:hypothetical protein